MPTMDDLKMWLPLLGAIGVIVLLFYSIRKDNARISPGNADNVEPTKDPKVVDCGNGVYYFNSTETAFGNALSGFLAAHPELEVTAMAPDVHDRGYTWGYFVTLRRRP